MENMTGNMKMPKQKTERGFTLLEAMISMAIGLIVMACHGQPVQDCHELHHAGHAAGGNSAEHARASVESDGEGPQPGGRWSSVRRNPVAHGSGSNRVQVRLRPDRDLPCPDPYLSHRQLHVWHSSGLPATAWRHNAVVPAAPAAVNDSITSIYCDYNFPAVGVQRCLHHSGQWRLHHADTQSDFRPGASGDQFRWRHSGRRSHLAQQQSGDAQSVRSRTSPRQSSPSPIWTLSTSIRAAPLRTTSRQFPRGRIRLLTASSQSPTT